MSKGYKILLSVLAIIFSMAACGLGPALASNLELTFPEKFFINFIFSMQFLSTAWCVMALFQKSDKS